MQRETYVSVIRVNHRIYCNSMYSQQYAKEAPENTLLSMVIEMSNASIYKTQKDL